MSGYEPSLERNIARDEAKADHRIVTFLRAELCVTVGFFHLSQVFFDPYCSLGFLFSICVQRTDFPLTSYQRVLKKSLSPPVRRL